MDLLEKSEVEETAERYFLNREESEEHKTPDSPTKILRSSIRRNSEELNKKCISYINGLANRGVPITVKRVAVGVGCSVSYIYKHKDILEYLKNKSKEKPHTVTKLSRSEKLLLDMREVEKENIYLKNNYMKLLRECINNCRAEELEVREEIRKMLIDIRDHKYRYELEGKVCKTVKNNVDKDGFLIIDKDSPLWKI